MAHRTLRPLVFAALLLAGNLAPARAEQIPAPTDALKDYHGLGFVQVEAPVAASSGDGKKTADVPFTTWFAFRQGYVRPDRMLMVMNVAGVVQSMLVTADTERTYSPSTGYVIQRTWKNLDPGAAHPAQGAQLSMATYARVLRELTSAKMLPAEDLDQVKTKLTARIEELRLIRQKLLEEKKPEDLPKANAAAAEQARLHNDLEQVDIRRAHPCYVAEFPNKDVLDTLLNRGLIGDTSTDFLTKGKTTVWITKAEGLPIKIETTSNDGHVAIFLCFTQLKINEGLQSNDLVLGAPPGTRLLAASADMRERGWEDKMDKSIALQIEAIEKERQGANPPIIPKKRR
jgi:hypothetical protein